MILRMLRIMGTMRMIGILQIKKKKKKKKKKFCLSLYLA